MQKEEETEEDDLVSANRKDGKEVERPSLSTGRHRWFFLNGPSFCFVLFFFPAKTTGQSRRWLRREAEPEIDIVR